MPLTVLITGANGNLGSEVVRHFLDAGFRVIAIDGKDDHLQFASGNPEYTSSIPLTWSRKMQWILC
jgi:nucleoside-diphosphate-sugar epimerase